uniref:Glutathione peroxidase n=1 Tax=Ciona intestinalis TaxID=7719 RepID=H2Y1N7_CIOIN
SSMAGKDVKDIYGFTVNDIDDQEVSLSKYKGHVCIIVNVASEFNYEQLQQLYGKYSQQGLKILAFPCNQFGKQEPKPNADIKKFATENYGVTFDLFSKINVNGDNAIPLYKFLKTHKNTTGTLVNAIKWNFTKFLVTKQGIPYKRFAPNAKPLDMVKDIEELLNQ